MALPRFSADASLYARVAYRQVNPFSAGPAQGEGKIQPALMRGIDEPGCDCQPSQYPHMVSCICRIDTGGGQSFDGTCLMSTETGQMWCVSGRARP
jgi:hypothetical protein